MKGKDKRQVAKSEAIHPQGKGKNGQTNQGASTTRQDKNQARHQLASIKQQKQREGARIIKIFIAI